LLKRRKVIAAKYGVEDLGGGVRRVFMLMEWVVGRPS